MVRGILIVTLFMTAYGTGVGVAMSSSAKHRLPTAANRQAARSAAQRLLSELRLPAGARSAQSDESRASLLGAALERPLSGKLIDLHRFWRVPGRPCKVMAWLEDHVPRHSKITWWVNVRFPKRPCRQLSVAERRAMIEAPRSAKRKGQVPLPPALGPVWGVHLSFPEVRGRFATRTLLIEVAAAEGGGTALRADAQVIWTHPAAPRERIPSGVRSVLVTAHDQEHRVSFRHIVRDRATVRRLVALVERLKLAPPVSGSMRSCPAFIDPELIVLSFRGRPHRRPLARLKIRLEGCESVGLKIHGHETQDLQGASTVPTKLEEMLGHRLRAERPASS